MSDLGDVSGLGVLAVFADALFGAFCGTSSCLGDRPRTVGVTHCGYSILLCDDEAANRAVFALGQTACGTGGRNCLVNDCGVTLGGDYGLLLGDSIADLAVLPFAEPRCGAGGGYGMVGDRCVTRGGNAGLRTEDLAAVAAFAAVG